ncbi:MAG: carbohydrate ABC transporter permease [Propionibacteriaceae bacterium]|nr:carbohydrate ABC transporter permease [Propionibacteriaceae bacterium]
MRRRESTLRRVWWWTVMGLAAVISLAPVLWTVSTSFKNQLEAQRYPPSLLPQQVKLSNYTDLFTDSDFHAAAVTSIIVTVCVTVLVLAVAFPCAYALVRLNAYGSKLVLLLIALAQTVPAIVVLIPLYSTVAKFHLYDTRTALVLVYTGLLIPFSTLVLMGFIRSVPVEIEDAALVDGCGRLKVLLWIVLPMARPALATAAVFTAIYAWNEFLIAAVLGGERARPLTVLISHFVSQKTILWGPMTAAVCLVLLPVVVVVVLLQRQLVAGLAAGATKG